MTDKEIRHILQEDDGDAGPAPHEPQEAASASAPATDLPIPPGEPQTGTQEAGRGLDAVVAVEVMGWRSYRYADSVPRGRELMRWLDDPQQMSLRGRGITEADPALPIYADGMDRVPLYSSDWSAMSLVVAEMGRRGWAVEMRIGDGKTWAEVIPDVITECYAEADTLPEAVSRAALQAVRAQKGGQP